MNKCLELPCIWTC